MVLRRLAALGVLGIGLFVFYHVADAALHYKSLGGDIYGYLLEPPSGILQASGSGLMILGGLLAAFKLPFGGSIGFVGGLILGGLGALLMTSTANVQDGLNEAMFGLAGLLLSILILTIRRR